jgi:nicotinamidase-related amidase
MIATIPGPAILDLNTQREFFSDEGAFPFYQFNGALDGLKKIFAWAQRSHVPVVSTRLRDLPNPAQQQTRGLAPVGKLICDTHSAGFQKLASTSLRRRREMPMDCGTSLPVEGFRISQQLIFDLPGLNPFECPRLDRLLSETEVGLWLVVGGPLEWTLRMAVLGLLQRRAKVAVISDCLGQWDPYEGDMALRQIESKNIEWMTAAQVVERYSRKPRTTHVPHEELIKAKVAVPAAAPAPALAKPAHGRSKMRSRGAFRVG